MKDGIGCWKKVHDYENNVTPNLLGGLQVIVRKNTKVKGTANGSLSLVNKDERSGIQSADYSDKTDIQTQTSIYDNGSIHASENRWYFI
ncbi:MAG: hypothetical protein IPL23_23270 [Saprospiraceae bacterium]|nr:hypothetical protein [Saprospiraceae bacterium]